MLLTLVLNKLICGHVQCFRKSDFCVIWLNMAKLSFCAGFLVILLLPTKSLFIGDSCFQEDQAGTCIQLSQCKPLWKEVQSAGRPMPLHIRRKLHNIGCGFDMDEQLVCCVSSSNDDEKTGNPTNWGGLTPATENPISHDEGGSSSSKAPHIRDTVSKKPPVTSNTGGGSNIRSEKRSGQPPDVQSHPNLNLLPTDNCGIVDSDRIFGGNRTRLYELPWMVLLSYNSARGTKLSCGGTLISEWYVLTAAHCVSFLGTRLKLNGVILGEHDIRKDPDCERVEDKLFCAPNVRNATIAEVIAHPGYSPQTLVDDIALIRLTEPADFTLASMKPICLPITPDLQNQYMDGMPATVAGWGATEDGLQSPVLLSVELPVVGNKECLEAYNGNPRLYDWQLCAGGVQDKDSCGGDSGGPLTFPGNMGDKGERSVQRGIVSYGSKRCGIGGFPGVYTRIAYYMDWILDNMHE